MRLRKLPPIPQLPALSPEKNEYISLLPDALRLINIYGVEYYIPWESIPLGGSVFLKTTATPDEVDDHLNRVNKHFKCEFVARQRCERGYFGIRIWRMR
jgi:hypothetical protein